MTYPLVDYADEEETQEDAMPLGTQIDKSSIMHILKSPMYA